MILGALICLVLTFMLTIIKKPLTYLAKRGVISPFFEDNDIYIWFAMVVILFISRNLLGLFHLNFEDIHLGLIDVLLIIGVVYLFAVNSEYAIPKTMHQAFVFVLLFPIGEELLFRGWIQNYAKELTVNFPDNIDLYLINNIPMAVLISAFCFGITHFQYNDFKINQKSIKQVLFAVAFGLFAGKMAYRTDSLVLPLIIHIFANGSVVFYGRRLMKNGLQKKSEGA